MSLSFRLYGRAFVQGLHEFFWPRRCAACKALVLHQPEMCLCEPCMETLRTVDAKQSCARCALPFSETTHLDSLTPRTCSDCKRIAPVFESITAAYQYGGALTHAVHQLKWSQRDDLARPLGSLLAPSLLMCLDQADVLIPVPLHRSRLVQRGYNQAALLAYQARLFCNAGIPILNHTLLRCTKTDPSGTKGPEERFHQVKDAFVVPSCKIHSIKDKHILLVDDVVTTGATAQACSLTLLGAGAKQVRVLTLCRTP